MISIVGLMALTLVGAIAIAFVFVLVRIFSPRDVVRHEDVRIRPRQRSGTGPVVALLLSCVVLLGLLVVGSFTVVSHQEPAQPVQGWSRTEVEPVQPQLHIAYSEGSEVIHEGSDGADVVAEESQPLSEGSSGPAEAALNDASADRAALPAWTKTPEVILSTGQVPTVRRVLESGLYATQDEAADSAMQKVQTDMRDRLSASYPQFASWTIPSKTIEAYCVKQKHVEVRQTQFGEYREPMYQVWLQYEDSPHVRDPIIAEWERSAVDGRSVLFVAGAGLLALALGTISAGTRMMIAPRGQKTRPAFATVALGVGTGLAAFSLFVA